jgi:hypothetical protein
MKKNHKFFMKDLDNDLDSLNIWISEFESKLIAHDLPKLESYDGSKMPLGFFEKLEQPFSIGTVSGAYYNIFNYGNLEIDKLKSALSNLLKEACAYYEIDYSKYTWGLRGWFNRNPSEELKDISPIDHPDNFHDHLDASGAPNFHGYYAVNAEPSVTIYKINNDNNSIVENINKNNRAILSEVGHPHGMGNWDSLDPRITIAYDITPITDNRNNYWTILE